MATQNHAKSTPKSWEINIFSDDTYLLYFLIFSFYPIPSSSKDNTQQDDTTPLENNSFFFVPPYPAPNTNFSEIDEHSETIRIIERQSLFSKQLHHIL